MSELREYRVNFASGVAVLAMAASPEAALQQALVALADVSKPEAPVSVDELPPLSSPVRVLELAGAARIRRP